MNRLFLLVAGLCIALTGMAQIDTTKTTNAAHADDTLRVGNLMIIRNGKPDWDNPTVIRVHHQDRKSVV